jgi:protein-tyrosine phosphatase
VLVALADADDHRRARIENHCCPIPCWRVSRRELDRAVKGRQRRRLPTIGRIDSTFDVLVLCTGNICRSPMAAALLEARLADRGVAARVASAGLSFDGRPPTDEAIGAALGYKVSIGDHRSRVLSAPLLETADLIIAMERFHVREAMVLDAASIERCFTLKELVRRGEAAGPRHHDESVPAWLRRVGSGRRTMELLGASDSDDVADPYQGKQQVYDACIAEIDELIRRLVDLVWPLAGEGVA